MAASVNVEAVVRDIRKERGERKKSFSDLAEYPNTIRVVSVVAFLIFWEVGAKNIDPILFATPSAIAEAFYRLTVSGELPREVVLSLSIFFTGFTLAVVVGIAVGLVMGRYRVMEYVLDPYINALYATPRVALIPLMILWLGLGVEAKVFIVFLVGFFPVAINTTQGVKNVSGSYVDIVCAYGASERQIFTKVIFPAAVPFIMTGLRLAVGRSLVGMVVAEMFTAIKGLGGMVIKYSSDFDTAGLFVPIIVLATLGVVLSELAKHLELVFSRWKETERA
jgi:NitT/TauT family transport system permease protein